MILATCARARFMHDHARVRALGMALASVASLAECGTRGQGTDGSHGAMVRAGMALATVATLAECATRGWAGRWSHGAMDGPARGCDGAGWHDPCNGSIPSQVWYKGSRGRIAWCDGAGWHGACNGSIPSQVWYKGSRGDGSPLQRR